MNASDFDHLDGSDGLGLGPDLTARLRAAAGAEPDLASAHAALGRRVAGARRRRAVAITGSAGLSVLLLGAVFVASTGDRGGRISSADAPAVGSFGDDGSITSVTATSVATTVENTVSSTVVTSLPGAPVGSASAPTSSVDDAGAGATDVELFDVTAAAAEVRTLSGIGGSVDVRVENGVLSLAGDPVAAPGFTAQVSYDEGDRLMVSFTSATHLTRLRVRLDGTRWRADRHEEAIPSSSVPGAPTGSAPHTSTDDDSDDSDDDSKGSNGSNGSNDDSDSDDDNDAKDDSDADDDSNRGSGSGGSNSGSGSGSSGSGSGGSDSDD